MKAKHRFLAIVVLLAIGGSWFGWTTLRKQESSKSSVGVGVETPPGPPTPGQTLRPPDPNRRFREMSPEERVQFARRPHGVGG